MSSGKRMRASGVPGLIARNLVIALTVAAAGCSADVTRFDFGSNKQTTGSIPIPEETVGSNYNGPPRGRGRPGPPRPPANDPPAPNTLTGNNYNSNTAAPPAVGAKTDATGNYRVVGRKYKTPPATEYTPPPAIELAPKQ